MNATNPEVAREEHDAWVRSFCPNDLGDESHRWGWWPYEPEGDIGWVHLCTNHGGKTSLVVARIDVTSGQRHNLISKEPLTIGGSIRCAACNDHGFIRDGKWVPA